MKRTALTLVGLAAVLVLTILAVGRYYWPASLVLSGWGLTLFPLRLSAEGLEWHSTQGAQACRLALAQLAVGQQHSGYFFHADRLILSPGCKQAAEPSDTAPPSTPESYLPLALPAWPAQLDIQIAAFDLAGELSGKLKLRRDHTSLDLQGALTGGAALSGLPLLSQDLPLQAALQWDLGSQGVAVDLAGAHQLALQAQGRLTPQLKADLSGTLQLRDALAEPLSLQLPFELDADLQRQQLNIQQGQIQFAEYSLILSNNLELSWPNYRWSLQASGSLPAELTNQLSDPSAADAQLRLTSEGQVDPLQPMASTLTGELTLRVTQGSEGSSPLLELHTPWQLGLAAPKMTLRPRIELQHPDQPLTLALQGEIDSDLQRLTASLRGNLTQPQLSDTRLALEGELQFAPMRYQGRVQGAGQLTDQPLSFTLGSAFTGDLNQVQLDLLPAESQARWQAADQSFTLSLQPGAGARVDLAGAGLSWQLPAQLLHPYGIGEITLEGTADLAAGGIDGQLAAHSSFAYSQQGVSATGSAQTLIALGGRLDAPLLSLQRLQATADLSGRTSPAAAFDVIQLQASTKTALNVLDPAAPLQMMVTATDAEWGGRPLPLPTLDLSLYPHAPTRPVAFSAHFDQGEISGQYRVSEGDLTARIERLALPPFAGLIDPVLTLTSGQLSGDLELRAVTSQPALAMTLQIEDIGGEYTGYLFQQLATSVDVRGSAEQLQASGQLSADLLHTGLAITAVSSDWALGWQPDRLQALLTRPEARILGGHFSADVLQYPSKEPQTLQLQGIDLAEAGALQSEPVVDVNGIIDLALPVTLAEDGLSVNDGRLANRGPIEFTVLDPALLDQYSQGNPLLASVLDPLKQMKIALFSADISMAKTGDALIQATVHGKNPAQIRPVHLNYRHEENLFDLLKSLRMSDSFQRQIEQQVEQQYSHEDKALNPGR